MSGSPNPWRKTTVTEMNPMAASADLAAALAEPFAPDALGWKPQSVSGSRALAIAYVDARDIMDRLDAVVGPAGWQDEYHQLPDGNVLCRLSLRVGGEWICKVDVGAESEQKDPGDRAKAAHSDALKRAAVKWGIARYLYRLPATWCDYDPQKKQLLRPPPLPAWALPRGTAAAPDAPARAADAAAMKQGVEAYDKKLADDGIISKGGLINHLLLWGQRECGWGPDMADWPPSSVNL